MEEAIIQEEKQLVKARIILEMLGKPKEHVEQALKLRIETLKEAGLKTTKEELVEAEEKSGGIFSAFADFEAEFASPTKLFDFCFDNMPSSVDVLEPSELKIGSKYFTNILNDMLAKLHEVDLMVGSYKQRMEFLDKNTVAVLRNFIHHLCGEEGGKTVEEIAKKTGIKDSEVKPFVDRLIDLDALYEKEGRYYQTKKDE